MTGNLVVALLPVCMLLAVLLWTNVRISHQIQEMRSDLVYELLRLRSELAKNERNPDEHQPE